jgi:hypothetical protein
MIHTFACLFIVTLTPATQMQRNKKGERMSRINTGANNAAPRAIVLIGELKNVESTCVL